MLKAEVDAYVWQSEGAAVTVHVREAALVQLCAKPESSGVLLGRRGVADGKPVLVVESAESFKSIDLSSAVGLYRADASADELTAEDRERLDRYMPGSAGVFLLTASEAAMATLFFCYQGRVTRMGQTPLPKVQQRKTAGTKSATLRRVGPSRKWLVVGACLLGLLGIAGVFFWNRPSESPLAEPSSAVAKPAPVGNNATKAQVDAPAPIVKPSPLVAAQPPDTAVARPIPLVNPDHPPPPGAQTPPPSRSKSRAVLTAPLRLTKWLFHRHPSN